MGGSFLVSLGSSLGGSQEGSLGVAPGNNGEGVSCKLDVGVSLVVNPGGSPGGSPRGKMVGCQRASLGVALR